MEVANTLTYFDTATITVVKSFMVQDPGANVMKIFAAVITNFCNKVERLSLASLSSPV